MLDRTGESQGPRMGKEEERVLTRYGKARVCPPCLCCAFSALCIKQVMESDSRSKGRWCQVGEEGESQGLDPAKKRDFHIDWTVLGVDVFKQPVIAAGYIFFVRYERFERVC